MAKEFRFFNVGKANAEIERLETALTEAQTKIAELSGNDSQIAAQAESIRADFAAAQLQVSELTAKLTASEATKAELAAKVAAIPAQVTTQAAAQAANIVSQVGVPPVAPGQQQQSISGNDFAELVKARMESAKCSKASAVAHCIASNPGAYAAWRASGNTSKL